MEPGKLSPKALALVKDSDTRLVVSSASAWEVSIKYHLGKLSGAEAVIENFSGHLERLQADVLGITPEHALQRVRCHGTTATRSTGCLSPKRGSSGSP